MSKAAIIYWSGTGNTETMAQAVEQGAGAEVILKAVSDITAEQAAEYDVLALGCPACGSEELEEAEFEPFFAELEGKISGKKVGLFGSHDWGDGEWMRTWESRVRDAGAELLQGEGIIADNEPDEDALAKCRDLGKQMIEG